MWKKTAGSYVEQPYYKKLFYSHHAQMLKIYYHVSKPHLQKMQENVQQMYTAAQKDLADKQDAAFAPIEKRFNDAVSRAAKANGWSFIFDSNNPAFIYKGGDDATTAVRKELGL